MKKLSTLFFRIICVGFSLFLLFLCLFADIRLSQTEKEIGLLTEQIAAAEEEQNILKVRLGCSMSLSELDAYAVNILGMQHPSPEQITYIRLS